MNSGCPTMFASVTFKETKTNTANSGVTPLMIVIDTNHNTVQKSAVLVDMQNNFMGNPYNVDNTHSHLTGNDQMILLLGVQVRICRGVINVVYTFVPT